MKLLWLSALFAAATSAAPTTSSLQCDDNIAITVSPTASILDIPLDFNLTQIVGDGTNSDSISEASSNLPKKTVSGTYTIRGRYCQPTTKVASREKTLQFLVHGITFTRSYWSGSDGDGNFISSEYSWQEYAAQQGYASFAIDRLCNGQSSKPNGALFCGQEMQAEALYEVIKQVRTGALGGTLYDKILYTGHSLGSLVGNVLGQLHPDAVEAYMLTGFTPFLNRTLVGVVVAGPFLPTVLVNPVRYADVALDLTYLSPASASGTEGIFYDGSYNESVAVQQFNTRGVAVVDDALTGLDGNKPAPGVTVPVMALNGQEDQIFCGANSLDLILGGHKGQCGTGETSLTAQTRSLYPNAKVFEYGNVASTGHNVNFHLTAQETFKLAHDFFAKQGF